jgi:hypothetical protein
VDLPVIVCWKLTLYLHSCGILCCSRLLVNVQNRRNATSKLAGIPPLYSFKSFIASGLKRRKTKNTERS